MKTESFLRIGVACIIAGAAIGSVGKFTSAQSDCPSGSHPASASELSTMSAAGIQNPQVGQCWDSSNANIGQAAGDAKSYLRQHATSGANISCLNAQFAEKIKNLMQAVPGGPPTITDGYRGLAAQAAALASGASKVGPCGSYHQYGLAADFNNASKQTLQWMRVNASQFGLAPVTNGDPTSGCTSHGFCDYGHIQIAGPLPSRDQCALCSASGANANGTGNAAATSPGAGRYTSTPGVSFFGPQSGISSSPGVGSMTPGQTYGQDTTCLLSTDPIYSVAIPAGTPFPSNCLNNGQTSLGTSGVQASCSGNTIIYNASGNLTFGQTCPYGCQNGICMQPSQNQQQGQQYAPANPSPSASSPTVTTSNGQTAVSSGVQNVLQTNTTPTLTTPTLIPNLLTPSSTLSILNALANPQQIVTTHATPTPITLNPDAQKISQLQAGAPPGVTYALPASSYFTGAHTTNPTTPVGGSTIITTPGTGYDMATPTDTRVVAIAGTRVPTGADTFTSSNLANTGAVPTPPAPVSTFPSSTTNTILETLKSDLQGVLNFLATYGRPFGGVVPSLAGGE
jgi:hypothetical protein